MNRSGVNTHSAPVKQIVNVHVEKQTSKKIKCSFFGRSVQQAPSITKCVVPIKLGQCIHIPKNWVITHVSTPVSHYPQQTSPLISEKTSDLIPVQSCSMASDEASSHKAPDTNKLTRYNKHRRPHHRYARLQKKNGPLRSTRDFSVVANHLTEKLQRKGFPANTPTAATKIIQDMAREMALNTPNEVEAFLDQVNSYEQYSEFRTPHIKNEQPITMTSVSNPGYEQVDVLTPSTEQPIITTSVSNPGDEKKGDALNGNNTTPAEPIDVLDKLRAALEDKGVLLNTEAHSDSTGALAGSDDLSAEYDDYDDDVFGDDHWDVWDDEAASIDTARNDNASAASNLYENIEVFNSSAHSESPQNEQPIITTSVSNPGDENKGDALNGNNTTPAEPINLVDKLRALLEGRGVLLNTETHSDATGALVRSDDLSAEYDDDNGFGDEHWDTLDDEAVSSDTARNDNASAASNIYENIEVLNSLAHSESSQGDLPVNAGAHSDGNVDESRKTTASNDNNPTQAKHDSLVDAPNQEFAKDKANAVKEPAPLKEQPIITTSVSNSSSKKKDYSLNNNKSTRAAADNEMDELTKKFAQMKAKREKASASNPSDEKVDALDDKSTTQAKHGDLTGEMTEVFENKKSKPVNAPTPSNEKPIITTSASNSGSKKKGDALNNNKSTRTAGDNVMDELTKKLAQRNAKREKGNE